MTDDKDPFADSDHDPFEGSEEPDHGLPRNMSEMLGVDQDELDAMHRAKDEYPATYNLIIDTFWNIEWKIPELAYEDGRAFPLNESLPVIAVLLPPDRTGIDFADPRLGFGSPDPMNDQTEPLLTARLWSDETLTVQCGEHWKFVVSGSQPFESKWLTSLTNRTDGLVNKRLMVMVLFDVPRAQAIDMQDMVDAHPTAFAVFEDIRPSASTRPEAAEEAPLTSPIVNSKSWWRRLLNRFR